MSKQEIKQDIIKEEPIQTRSQYPGIYYYLDNKNRPAKLVKSEETTAESSPTQSSETSEIPQSPPSPVINLELLFDTLQIEEPSGEHIEMASEIRPPSSFSGESGLEFSSWIRELQNYMEFKETPNGKKLQLLKYLLKDEAADWLEGLPADKKDTFDHLTEALKERYESKTNDFITAKELFNRKQKVGETVDMYITNMRKMGRKIGADDKMIGFAVMNGVKSEIAGHYKTAARRFRANIGCCKDCCGDSY